MANSTDYASSQVNLAVGSQGGGGGRQAGSTFKVFAVAEALSQGMTLNRSYPAPYNLVVPNGNGQGDNWPVHNDSKDGVVRRASTWSTALANSINTYFAQLVTDINPQNLANMAKRMGVASALNPVPSLRAGHQRRVAARHGQRVLDPHGRGHPHHPLHREPGHRLVGPGALPGADLGLPGAPEQEHRRPDQLGPQPGDHPGDGHGCRVRPAGGGQDRTPPRPTPTDGSPATPARSPPRCGWATPTATATP